MPTNMLCLSSLTPALQLVATEVRTCCPSPLLRPAIESRAGMPIPCRGAALALCEDGFRAGLGYIFLQVPLPSPPRPQPARLPSLGSFTLSAKLRRAATVHPRAPVRTPRERAQGSTFQWPLGPLVPASPCLARDFHMLIVVAHVAVAEPAGEPTPDARPYAHEHVPRCTPSCALARASAHTCNAKPSLWLLFCVVPHARTPAFHAGEGHPSHAAGGSVLRRHGCATTGPILGQRPPLFFAKMEPSVHPHLAMGRVAQPPWTLTTSEVMTVCRPFGAFHQTPSIEPV
jgi:hypothetical protein